MPDGHAGYGLPIGGVLATENAVIPYGVGVDIGCMMALTIYDVPDNYIDRHVDVLKRSLLDNTRFGPTEVHAVPSESSLFDRKEFDEIRFLNSWKDKARKQLGTSGSGNHYTEYGIVKLHANNALSLPEGQYLGIMTHSGSRGMGANVAKYYTNLAMESCVLPQEAKHLAWLDLNTEEGQEYWLAMNLCADYASACHHDIHKRLAKSIGMKPIAALENRHNLAWKETHDGRELIVHRKGATPAAEGVLGIIPGSMATEAFIVRGKGNPASLNSASHGAGRLMSRTKARESFTNKMMQDFLRENNVTLISAGLDEAPMAYKDIHAVMAKQIDLVEVMGTFMPRIVRMDNGDEE
jgi:tRNA-splicing ligase RtcB